MSFGFSSAAARRTLLVAALSTALLAPATATLAASPSAPTGTVVGTVTCGPDEDTSAPQARIVVDGMNLSTVADGSGKFTLLNVPTGQLLTIDALADPAGAVTSTRYNVSVAPGGVTDIGNLDLAACTLPQPTVQPIPTGDFGGPAISPAPSPSDYSNPDV